MICFLTSSPVTPGTMALNPANGFIDELRRAFPARCRGLFVCADPDCPEKTDRIAREMRIIMGNSGFQLAQYGVLDGRNAGEAAALVDGADFIILSGGHVPTQNRFFEKIGLRTLLRGFDGVVMGISAGTMNAADVVYAQPEEPGEAVDPAYRRFLRGLNLTKTMILPHYQMIKNDTLDGLRLFADIACPDSVGRRFYALVDGSYLFVDGRKEELWGEAYLIENGKMCPFTGENESARL